MTLFLKSFFQSRLFPDLNLYYWSIPLPYFHHSWASELPYLDDRFFARYSTWLFFCPTRFLDWVIDIILLITFFWGWCWLSHCCLRLRPIWTFWWRSRQCLSWHSRLHSIFDWKCIQRLQLHSHLRTSYNIFSTCWFHIQSLLFPQLQI